MLLVKQQYYCSWLYFIKDRPIELGLGLHLGFKLDLGLGLGLGTMFGQRLKNKNWVCEEMFTAE